MITTEYAYSEPTPYEIDLSVWSDAHKAAYGFRPRGVKNPTIEELPAEFERLQKIINANEEEEHLHRLRAQRLVKHYVRECMKTGMTALAALEEDFRLTSADPMYGWENYCYARGIGYHLDRWMRRRGIAAPGPAWGEHED